MATTARRPAKPKAKPKVPWQASVNFPAELYATLERIAQEKKGPVAGVVRDTAEKYVGEQCQ